MTKAEAKAALAKMMAEGMSPSKAQDSIYKLASVEGFWGENHYVVVRLVREVEAERHGSVEAIRAADEARWRADARKIEATQMSPSEAKRFYATHDHEEE